MWVGYGKRPPEWVAQVLEAESRIEAGPTAPPQGLFLVAVRYDPESMICHELLFRNARQLTT